MIQTPQLEGKIRTVGETREGFAICVKNPTAEDHVVLKLAGWKLRQSRYLEWFDIEETWIVYGSLAQR